MTSLHELLHLAATPTDVRTECRICSRDSDPAICGDDGWVCVPCAISDPARAVVTCPGIVQDATDVWLGERLLASVWMFEPDMLASAVAAVLQLLVGDDR